MISIILSSYNGEKYIDEQLDSLVNQSYKNIEIIVVDDCSTDTTLALIKEFELEHEFITLYEGNKNLGYVKNFERGVRLAKGEYIAFCDQDDYWLPNKLELLIKAIGSYDVAYCDSQLVNNRLEPIGKNMSIGHNFITSNNPLNFMVKNCVSGHAMIFKKDLLTKDFEFPKLIPHDWWVTFLASCSNGVVFVDEVLVKYRIHDTNQIGGEGHQKISKVVKNEHRKVRVKVFSMYLKEINHKAKKTAFLLTTSYSSNSIVNRFKRVFVFITNTKKLFIISDKSKVKKYFYALSMFFKIR